MWHWLYKLDDGSEWFTSQQQIKYHVNMYYNFF